MLELEEWARLSARIAARVKSDAEEFEDFMSDHKIPEARRAEFLTEWRYLIEFKKQNPGGTIWIPSD